MKLICIMLSYLKQLSFKNLAKYFLSFNRPSVEATHSTDWVDPWKDFPWYIAVHDAQSTTKLQLEQITYVKPMKLKRTGVTWYLFCRHQLPVITMYFHKPVENNQNLDQGLSCLIIYLFTGKTNVSYLKVARLTQSQDFLQTRKPLYSWSLS